MTKIIFVCVIFFRTFSFGQASGPTCDNWSKENWDKFIKTQLPRSAATIVYEIDNARKACPDNFKRNEIDICTDRIEGYYKQFFSEKGGMYSTVMSDDQYINSQPKGVVELPSELAQSANGLPQNWREVAEKNGWKWVLFHSNTASEPRLVFYIPGKEFDRLIVYYSFNSEDTSPASWAGIQMQAIEKNRDGKKPELPKYFFKSWTLPDQGRIPKQVHKGGRCVSCHVSGPRALVMREAPDFKTEMGGVKSVDEFNKLIVHEGDLDYSPYYDQKYFPNHLEVGNDCRSCHNGKNRSSLARSIDRSGYFVLENIRRKVVQEKTMPKEYYGGTLDHNDRAVMLDEIANDYRTKIDAWLTEVSCAEKKLVDPSKSSGTPAKSNSPPSDAGVR